MMKLSEQTPPQVDEQLAALWGRRSVAENARTSAVNDIHRAIGERPLKTTRGGRAFWPTLDLEAIAACRVLVENYAPEPGEWHRPTSAIAAYDKAMATVAEVDVLIEPLNAEYARRQWSRFFLVTAGHIHRSTNCSTCYVTTEFGWLPELSGLTEADAVAAHGPLLCTICYPSAPVEWTVGRPPSADACPGGGQVPDPTGRTWRNHSGYYATCAGCNELFPITNAGVIRKHKTPKPTAKGSGK